ncbi:MAG: arsenate reductase ArsC [Alphaproteobacteria bacterium]|nr:arsenate reductase ArsC [Alphaproteobacteria bacterium]
MTPRNILILCTGNSARSILAEALVNRLGQGRWRAFSAGSHPKSAPNPFALELLRAEGFDVSGLGSKSWDAFAAPGAPVMDLVVTVCDDAAGEACPVWPGGPMTAHWGLPDPAAEAGGDADKRRAFRRAYVTLEARIRAFLALDAEALDAVALRRAVDAIGRIPAAGSDE